MNTMKKNNSYGMGGKSYRMGGKLSKQETKLLKMLMTKAMGEEGMRVMQNSGRAADDSFLQDAYDDASAIGMGLLNILRGEGDIRERYEQGFGEEKQADLARQMSGQAGGIDAAGAAVGSFFDELLAPGYEYKPASVQKHPIDAATRAYNRARMTNEEREALRREQEARRNR